MLAQVLGRPNQASVDAVEDPWYTIVSQHFKTMRRLLLQWPERDFPRVQQGWQRLEAWLREAEHPWKRAAGPLGACWCYLQEMEWEPITVHRWRIGPKVYDILKAEDFHEVLFLTNRWVTSRRHARLAALDGGQGLHTGPDWKVPERLLKKADHLTGVALKAIWQGGFVHPLNCHLSETLLLDLTSFRQLPGYIQPTFDLLTGLIRQEFPDPFQGSKDLGSL